VEKLMSDPRWTKSEFPVSNSVKEDMPASLKSPRRYRAFCIAGEFFGPPNRLEAGKGIGERAPGILRGYNILPIDGTAMPTNIISGFEPGDLIDLSGVTFASGGTVSASGGVLHILENGKAYTGTFITFGQQVITGNATVTADTAISGRLLVSGGSLTVLSGGFRSPSLHLRTSISLQAR
jgi:hypothetical protein